jgi:glycosyltransferase involved in cell wall biosynthesis
VPARGDASPPALSVVTPAFNAARFLEETLDSVSALSVAHEHVVVDDGSTDDTRSLLRAREDPSLRWESQANRGQAGAVNTGLTRARGDLLAWLNADDTYVPRHVDSAVRVLLEDSSIDAVIGFMEIVDDEGHLLKVYRCGPFSWTRFLYWGGYWPTPTAIFRRSLLSQAPQLNERYVDASDVDFYLRLFRGAKVRRIRKPLVRFRYHPTSKTGARVEVQRGESLEIRLGFARSGAERRLIRSLSWVHDLRDSVVGTWPELSQER